MKQKIQWAQERTVNKTLVVLSIWCNDNRCVRTLVIFTATQYVIIIQIQMRVDRARGSCIQWELFEVARDASFCIFLVLFVFFFFVVSEVLNLGNIIIYCIFTSSICICCIKDVPIFQLIKLTVAIVYNSLYLILDVKNALKKW